MRCQIIVLLFFVLLGCSKEVKEERNLLTQADKQKIEGYSRRLVDSINGFDHSLIKKSWSYNAFRGKVTGLTKTQQSVFNYIFEREIADHINVTNASLVNNVNLEGGSVKLINISHNDYSSELLLALLFETHYSLMAYEIQIIDELPYLVDMRDLKNDLWLSESVKNLVNLSTRHTGTSLERREANIAYSKYVESLYDQDTSAAFGYLSMIPRSHWIGNGLSIARVDLAYALDQQLFYEVLDEERAQNDSDYLKYLDLLTREDSLGLEQLTKN
ncbi:hypothetical protein [Roseivirga pacifica]|uniref:hypothetical protein n=1 Tax=Roseivirga pacifica TaxID=1267423 RepID=UPI003BAEAEDD